MAPVPEPRYADLKDLRAITLDLDDTLWEVAPVIRRAEEALWEWLAAHHPAIPAQYSREAAADLRARVVREHPDRVHDLTFLRKTVLGRMAESTAAGPGLVEQAFAVFDAARNRVELFPDVRPALERLGRRYTLVAVTNGNANLDTIGIRELFDDAVSAADAGAAKPARPIFEQALRRAGARAAETLHVGDHPEYDVAGARQAGLRTAWLNRRRAAWPGELPAPDAEVGSLTELVDLLASAGGGAER